MTFIPHSTHDDEARFVSIISDLISQGNLPSSPNWQMSIRDEKSKRLRKKQSEKEAQEAEKMAKELGVWDEFYGSGKTGTRKAKGKSSKSSTTAEGEEDHSALQALILKKKNMDGFFDSLAAKYAESDSSGKSKEKKRSKATEEDDVNEPPKKKLHTVSPPDIDDAEFEKLQQKLFGDKSKPSSKKTKTRKLK